LLFFPLSISIGMLFDKVTGSNSPERFFLAPAFLAAFLGGAAAAATFFLPSAYAGVAKNDTPLPTSANLR
jgi:hypothetical protein